jgi:hypothetical protein
MDPVKLARFQALENQYSNLVYACPQVNRAKSNDWASDDPSVAIWEEKGYLDPCNNDFNDFFERTDDGKIMPKDNPVARYMWRHLKLYLERYAIYWRLEKLFDNMDKLMALNDSGALPDDLKMAVEAAIVDLTREYIKYRKYLEVDYNSSR